MCGASIYGGRASVYGGSTCVNGGDADEYGGRSSELLRAELLNATSQVPRCYDERARARAVRSARLLYGIATCLLYARC